VDNVFTCIAPIEPSIRINFAGQRIIRLFAVKDSERKAVCVEIISRKPTRRDVRATRKPFAAFESMTNKESGRVTAFNKTDRSRWPARMKDVGNVIDGFEIQFRIDAGSRAEQIARHKKIGRIIIRNALGRRAKLEMLKGKALKNILKSTEIVAEFPKQVRMLKPIDVISGLKGKKKGLKKRYTDGRNTVAFHKWCRTRDRAKRGDKKVEAQILRWGEQAEEQLAAMLGDMQGFADNIDDATGEFTTAELAIVRNDQPNTDDMIVKVLDGTLNLARKFFAMHPGIKMIPAAHELPETFIFRFSLCAYLHALRWRAAGGAAGALRERMRQDVIDVTYAAYALCFDGLFTKDKMPKEIHEKARSLLPLFAKYVPKPSRRGSKGVNAADIAVSSEAPG
jgi:hypothetical protein